MCVIVIKSSMIALLRLVFLFKQKTAYEMRISDWSSDVCSSDLKTDVRSPKVSRRQSVILGSRTPVIRSRNWRTEVWSNGWLETQPPAVQGETMMQGTRKPAPIGRSSTNSRDVPAGRSEEHTSELQSLMRISYAVFCLKQKKQPTTS